MKNNNEPNSDAPAQENAPAPNVPPVEPPAPENDAPKAPAPANNPVVGNIAERLAQKEASASVNPEAARGETPAPFDISKLSKEQLQSLKAQLAVTPDAPQMEKQNPVVLLRKIAGRYVVDFQNSYLALVYDHEQRRDTEQHKIPVKFMGDDEYTDIMWKEFIQSDQVKCEVVSSRYEDGSYSQGMVRSRQTGLPTELTVRTRTYYFTVKLPEGQTVELPGHVVNG